MSPWEKAWKLRIRLDAVGAVVGLFAGAAAVEATVLPHWIISGLVGGLCGLAFAELITPDIEMNYRQKLERKEQEK